MAVGSIHTIAQDLHVVEGHHPRTPWEDPDIPGIVVFRTGRRLYLLDSGLGHLDVLVLRRELPQLDQVLAEHGFVRTLLWPNENQWIVSEGVSYPTAFVMTDVLGRELDIHVVEVDADGEPTPLWRTSRRLEARFLDSRGCIAGTPVACMSREGQLAVHTDYNLPASHQADVARLQSG